MTIEMGDHLEQSEITFRDDEIPLLLSLTSLNYVKFTLSAKNHLPEKFLLYKACRVYENQLLKLLARVPHTLEEEQQIQHELQAVYMELGNVNLLAQDFTRALSAYQKAYALDKQNFWREASGLYGLGIVYLNFRVYKPAIEAFCQLIYCHPHLEIITEVHARLGITYKCVEDFPQALKHLLITHDDVKELELIPKYQLRFHIAHCYDGSDDFRRAVEEYRRLLSDHERNLFRLPVELLAVIHRQLGWISLRSREKEFKEDVRAQKLREAEQQLTRARELLPTDSKTNCYLGLCFSEQITVPAAVSLIASGTTPPNSALSTGASTNSLAAGGSARSTSSNGTPGVKPSSSSAASTPSANVAVGQPQLFSGSVQGVNSDKLHIQQKQQQFAADKAQEAFICYRSAIDSDESDANTWCSIGILYQQQNQPLDALQAFACAVQLNDKHSAAWTELGRLYETHRQYNECLYCYRKSLQHNPVFPETLRVRVSALEKEFGSPAGANLLMNYIQTAQQTSNNRLPFLPPLENAWQLGIPAQVRQRLSDLHKQQENRYREGSPLWTMSELAAHAMRQSFYEFDPTQRKIMQVLKLNKEQLENNELSLLKQLENRYGNIVNSKKSNNGDDRCETSISTNDSLHDRESAHSTTTADDEKIQLESSHRGDELKLRISRHSSSDTSTQAHEGLPYITQDDLADVLGDDFESKSKVVAQKSPQNRMKRHSTSPKERSPRGGSDEEHSSPDDGQRHSKKAGSKSKLNITALEVQKQRLFSARTSDAVVDDLPAFSLLARVHVPVTVSSAEVFDACKKRRLKSEDFRPIFDECVPPPLPPEPPAQRPVKDALLLKTPLIVVENAREALTTELQNFCYNSQIALVHGLTGALKIDLSQFSTKSLIQAAPDHEVEVRTQYKMNGDINVDNLGNSTWLCHSTKSFTTVSRYGQYQAESFRHSLKEETEKLRQALPRSSAASLVTAGASAVAQSAQSFTMAEDSSQRAAGQLNGSGTASKRRKIVVNGTNGANAVDLSLDGNIPPLKTIKFGTNVDLSDERKFQAQLKELNKMPAFCQISAACNMLTHLGHTVLGMNTVQLYMKVPGCRTPGHLENNSFASININIGPGECEWFGVPHDYWPIIEQMCKERNIDFLKGAWWPPVQDLINANVPFYRFTQKAGDVVWVGGGCVHWVQATGWCNNVAWNVGPMTANQLEMALYAHEWNRLNSYRSLVPMQHLAWQLARDVRFSNQKMFNVIKNILIRSLAYCRMVADFVERRAKMPIKFQSRQKGETAHYCHLCDIEVFNLLFVKEIGGKFRVFCVQCARKNDIDDYVVLQQISFDELANVFDRFQLHPSKAALIC